MNLRTFWIFLLLISLSGCSAFSPAAPTALPTVALDQPAAAQSAAPGGRPAAGVVAASGVAAPAEQAQMVFASAGRVKSVSVMVGDAVQAGQTLVQLEGQEDLQAKISAAGFELAQAQQALEDLKTSAETARVQAMQDIVTYQQAVKNAQYALDNFTIPTGQAGMDAVSALTQMEQRLNQARAAFEPYKYRPSGDDTREDLKDALDEAQAAYNTAVKRLQYEYDLQVAQTRLAKAQHDYAVLQAGPDPAQARLAEARVANAQTQLQAAQAALERLTLTAPFAGTVSQVQIHPGEWVIAGQPILTLADLAHLQVETNDLSERDVPQVHVGQPVTVYVKALNQNVAGRVARIAPLAETLGGDVVYTATIELDSLPEGLRAGMSVEVQFGTGN